MYCKVNQEDRTIGIRLFFRVHLWCVLTIAAAVADEYSITIEYSREPQFSEIRLKLTEDGTLTDAIEFINELFILQYPITVDVGAADGPLYDSQNSTIEIPYDFYTQTIDRFRKIEKDDETLDLLASDAMLHTLFHELGHALIDQLQLPIVGREEDAADAFANVLLLEYYDNGAEIAANAAELFALEGEDRGALVEEDFWDEHSLDEQRYFSTLCHIYGSAPKAFYRLQTGTTFPSQRGELCEETYERLVDDWAVLLKPFIRAEN